MAGVCRHLRCRPAFALSQINTTNAKDLHVVWRWKSPDHAIKDGNPKIGPTRANESTPLMIGGTLYTSTSLSQVAAIDATSTFPSARQPTTSTAGTVPV